MDRNPCYLDNIEITQVALRKESVDRNTSCTSIGRPKRLSLSARRAWIEIDVDSASGTLSDVALRKESVDRNSFGLSGVDKVSRRSPQGERG